MGNKWTEIAHYFPDKYLLFYLRSHNCIKNHFYAEIRKAIRRINFFIRNQFDSKEKSVNMSNVSKMITLLSEKKNVSSHLSHLVNEKGQIFLDFKSKIFKFAKKDERQLLNEEELSELI